MNKPSQHIRIIKIVRTRVRLGSPARTAFRGFTLLEVLVVLAIIAMVASVALPNFARMIESYQQKATLGLISSELSGLSYRAFSEAQPITLSENSNRALVPSLPVDWQITITAPISIQANGFCSGGSASIKAKSGAVWQVTLAAPLCKAEYK